jgi:predicted helicase
MRIVQVRDAGVLAFIGNHRHLDNPTLRSIRLGLMQTFDEIYTMDLHGNTKKRERAPDGSKDDNVFDIQQGVGICLPVKLPKER